MNSPSTPFARGLLASAILLGAAASTVGCASTGSAREDLIRDARRGRDVTFRAMADDLASVRMVHVGEAHTHPGHHDLQLRILQTLQERGLPLLLGMEMFERPYQPILDRWSAGTMTEDAFLRETSWYQSWGYDWTLYRPLLLYARDHHIPVIALNAERAIISAINRSGLEELAPWMRARLPDELPVPSSGRHRDALVDIWRMHTPEGKPIDRERFERFYQAQCTWDETMAESAARALAADPRPGAVMVVLAGSGHIEGFHCIPERARRRNGFDYRTVLPVPGPGVPGHEATAKDGPGRDGDYLVPSGPLPPGGGWVGVVLRGGDNLVTLVAEGSPAGAAGLKVGDRLTGLGDMDVADLLDLKRALDGRTVGDSMEIRWTRDGAAGSGRITLAAPPPPVFR